MIDSVLGAAIMPGPAAPMVGRPVAPSAMVDVELLAGRDPLRLQGVVVAMRPEGAVVEFAGRTMLLAGAPALRPGAGVTVQVAPGQPRLPAVEPIAARLLMADGAGASFRDGLPVRLLPTAASATLDARAGPVLPATLALPPSSAVAALRVLVVVTPTAPDGARPPATAGGLVPVASAIPTEAVLEAMAAGAPVAAVVLPRTPGAMVSLGLDGGLVLHFDDAAVDLPQGGRVDLRLADLGRAESADIASAMRRTLQAEDRAGRDEVGGPTRLTPDARLGAKLEALADALGREAGADASERTAGPARQPADSGAGQSPPVVALLGELERPHPLRLARERDAERPVADGEETERLVLDVAFARLGRVRLEIDRPPGGELRIVLRGERPLTRRVRADLIDLVGAAFELGGARAWFATAVGGLPPVPAGVETTA